MTKQVQFRRGTTAQHGSFTGALAEITVDTNKKTAIVHDGTQVGGFPLVGSFGGSFTFTTDLDLIPAATKTLSLRGGNGATASLVFDASNNAQFFHNLTIGNASSDTLTVNSAATFESTLSLDGTTTVNAPVTFTGGNSHLTLTGELRGPSTFIIDPAVVGDDTGLVRIKGDLEVLGTTTTINSTVTTIADPIIELRRGNSITAASGGVQVNLTTNGSGTVTGFQRLQWNNAETRWETTDGAVAKPIVNTVDVQTIAGNKTFSNNLTASGANAAIQFSPTGTGSVTINPATAGSIDRMNIGATVRGTGAFTTLDANSTVGLSPANANVTVSPTGSGLVTINPATAGSIDRMNIGANVKGTGAFSSLAIKDTSANHDVAFVPTSSTALTASRTLTFDVVNAARTIKLAGNLDIANNLSTVGNFALTLTSTNTTNATLPSGTVTLVDLASAQDLSNKTCPSPVASNSLANKAYVDAMITVFGF